MSLGKKDAVIVHKALGHITNNGALADEQLGSVVDFSPRDIIEMCDLYKKLDEGVIAQIIDEDRKQSARREAARLAENN